jgi:uncharacterized RmlC-like cupin family protein
LRRSRAFSHELGDFLTCPAALPHLPIDPLDSANNIKVAVSA